MEHYITLINIKELYHLSDIQIELDKTKRQHLLITGKNGSGKTSLLLEIEKYLKAINDNKLLQLANDYKEKKEYWQQRLKAGLTIADRKTAEENYNFYDKQIKEYCNGVEIKFNEYQELDMLFASGKFVTAYYPAERKSHIQHTQGVENIRLDNVYRIESNPGNLLLKYMVHLKTQQSYARNENDTINIKRIQEWFDRFENALKILLDEDSIHLEYDYKNYDFKIIQSGRKPFTFHELSDGYSSMIYILADLILRMDKNWLLNNELSQYSEEGIVLIDELETHLHIELQKKILPFLTEFFPRIQFIVTTHSPYILNSISNAKAYDLEHHVELTNLSSYRTEDLAEAYFDVDEYSNELKEKLKQYELLSSKTNLSDEEKADRAKIRCDLKESLSKFQGTEAGDMFEYIERRRKMHDKD